MNIFVIKEWDAFPIGLSGKEKAKSSPALASPVNYTKVELFALITCKYVLPSAVTRH
jgi:hypothetical protein